MQELTTVATGVAQIIATISFVFWLTKRNTNKIDYLYRRVEEACLDIAVIKTQILSAINLAQDVRSDHDRLVSIEKDVSKNSNDINAQFTKIRTIKDKLNEADKKLDILSSNLK